MGTGYAPRTCRQTWPPGHSTGHGKGVIIPAPEPLHPWQTRPRRGADCTHPWAAHDERLGRCLRPTWCRCGTVARPPYTPVGSTLSLARLSIAYRS